jgi:predicted TIM-barrel fold metal-dependent hydrolase
MIAQRTCLSLSFHLKLSLLLLLVPLGCSQPEDLSQHDEPRARAESSAEVLQEIQARRAIIDVHEHIMSIHEAPMMLRVMDTVGIAKTVLMGSSWFTITLNESIGFTRYDENNESILQIVAAHPDRFEAWPTLNPEDPDKLPKLRAMVARGATGVKLYIGHGYVRRDGEYMFHTRAMDDPEMLEVYAFCQDNFIPICLHVNPHYIKPGFAQEFIEVLTQFPDLKVVSPHFILSSSWYSRFQEFMDTFPNLYTDCSFGDSFVEERLRYISRNTTIVRGLFEKYPERIMFGCDLVVTDHPAKTEQWALEQYAAYLSMLTEPRYTTPVIPKRDENKQVVPGELEELRGLELPRPILENVLYKNFEAMKASRPRGTRITREINWNNMRGSQKIDRMPGQAFPPLDKGASEH